MNTCSARFPPDIDHLSQATTIKHLHFKGHTDYADASAVQNQITHEHLAFKVLRKNSRLIAPLYPAILTFEFNSVYTGGKRERDSRKATKLPMDRSQPSVTSTGIPYVQTDRGGQVTYHGPGQLVAYFVWDLKLWKNLTSKCFVNFIEQCSLQTISKTGVPGVCTTENTGVWVSKNGGDTVEKISSIGLNLKRNVTSHGLSINLSPNLTHLNNPDFVMCGLEGFHQTSIVHELGKQTVGVEQLGDLLCETVKDRMNSYMMNSENDSKFRLSIEKQTLETTSDFKIDIVQV